MKDFSAGIFLKQDGCIRIRRVRVFRQEGQGASHEIVERILGKLVGSRFFEGFQARFVKVSGKKGE